MTWYRYKHEPPEDCDCDFCVKFERIMVPVEPDYGAAQREWDRQVFVNVRDIVDAALEVGEETPCKGCGGRGWYEGVEPDPRDQTGMTPMQVQIQCPCKGVGEETP